MYCSHCGAQLKQDAIFCHKCGERVISSGVNIVLERIASQLNFKYTDIRFKLYRKIDKSILGFEAGYGAYCKTTRDAYFVDDSQYYYNVPLSYDIDDVHIAPNGVICKVRLKDKWGVFNEENAAIRTIKCVFDSVNFVTYKDPKCKNKLIAFFECEKNGLKGIVSYLTYDILVPFGKYDTFSVNYENPYSWGYDRPRCLYGIIEPGNTQKKEKIILEDYGPKDAWELIIY